MEEIQGIFKETTRENQVDDETKEELKVVEQEESEVESISFVLSQPASPAIVPPPKVDIQENYFENANKAKASKDSFNTEKVSSQEVPLDMKEEQPDLKLDDNQSAYSGFPLAKKQSEPPN